MIQTREAGATWVGNHRYLGTVVLLASGVGELAHGLAFAVEVRLATA